MRGGVIHEVPKVRPHNGSTARYSRKHLQRWHSSVILSTAGWSLPARVPRFFPTTTDSSLTPRFGRRKVSFPRSRQIARRGRASNCSNQPGAPVNNVIILFTSILGVSQPRRAACRYGACSRRRFRPAARQAERPSGWSPKQFDHANESGRVLQNDSFFGCRSDKPADTPNGPFAGRTATW